MRLSFDMMCLVAAAVSCMVGGSPLGQIEDPTKRHSRIDERPQEERGFAEIFNQLAEKLNFEENNGVENALKISNPELPSIPQTLVNGKLSISDLRHVLDFDEQTGMDQIKRIVLFWTNKMKELDAKHVKTSATLLDFFKVLYTDEQVAKIIAIAQKHPDTLPIAFQLQWLREKKDPDDLLLTLQNESNGFPFEHSLFPNWIDYVEAYNKKHPDQTKTVLKRLDGKIRYNLIDMLFFETTRPSTFEAKAQVLNELIKSWIDAEYDPFKVYKDLGLDAGGEHIDNFDDSRFVTWVYYIVKYDEKEGKKVGKKKGEEEEKKEVPFFMILEMMYGKDEIKKTVQSLKEKPTNLKSRVVAKAYEDYLKF